ncbi:hypothetical protein LZC95_21950 [Pendulispora brunnea]|uniref:Cytochrome c domain-containing protein n=1 Tax=Pendulispora brunnea TaxID=2905690 RepID=A0ABZ2KR04_9BACT
MLAKTRYLTIGLGLVMAAAASAPGCKTPAPNDLSEDPLCKEPTAQDCGKNIGTGGRTPPSALEPPKITTYKRSSLVAPFQLLPLAAQGRINEDNRPFTNADYTTADVTVSTDDKLTEIQAQINRERAASQLPPLATDIVSATDKFVTQQIPFRGNPSDVKYVNVNGRGKAYIPLGGDVTTPGNEVTIVDVSNNGSMRTLDKLKVGLRPQRLALHPAGDLMFVCNQYSNYISIIDTKTDKILEQGGKPVEIPTHYYCADVAFVPEDGVNKDNAKLFVANRWRHSVLEYQVNIERDQINNQPVGIKDVKEIAEIMDVGNNPYRLVVDDAQKNVYVANNKGGEVAKIDVANGKASGRMTINGASTDLTVINDLVYITTTTIDRGLPDTNENLPAQVAGSPVKVKGIDGKQYTAHPGALGDRTRSYNFEDLRNGIVQLPIDLNKDQLNYYTDNNSGEPNFEDAVKVIDGAVPTTIIRNKRGDRIYVALGATDTVQELEVNTAAQPNTLRARQTWHLDHRPFGLALDEDNGRLFVADWASERLEVCDLNSFDPQTRRGRMLGKVNLDYANPPYPATTVEIGERFFYEASWSNTGRKSCATCHVDELDTDGVGYANGATAPTAYHQVKPNHNLAETDSYFWNGSFANGNYTSLAFAAQTRPNCQLIEFGFIDGVSSDPKTRIGDRRGNLAQTGNDLECRPISAGPRSSLIKNQARIDQIVAQGVAIMDQRIADITRDLPGGPFSRRALSRAIDAYSVAEMRLPPNPLKYAAASKQLDDAVIQQITKGQQAFQNAGCAGCHTPGKFADGLDHGRGAAWLTQFVNTYRNDPRIQAVEININGQIQRGFAQTMTDAIRPSVAGPEINVHPRPLDYFVPFCFQADNCVEFQDPLAAGAPGSNAEEDRRLKLLIQFNLGDPDRTFIPGNVVGQPHINTPSLRGVWTQAALLHHGMATTIREAILAPGHPALGEGEAGWAVLQDGTKDVHGVTSSLSKEDVDALVRYVESIE